MLRPIAEFPIFSKLDLSHKEGVDSITSGFEPYSDFNFISLYCWNTDGSTELSTLNDNLVIKLPDYVTGKPVYSILGNTEIDNSIERLLGVAKKLKLVPEPVIKNMQNKAKYQIDEDIDNFDYIYDLTHLSGLSGGEFKGKRRNMARFLKKYGDKLSVSQIDLQNQNSVIELTNIFKDWARDRGKLEEEIDQESKALTRLLENPSLFNLVTVKIAVNNQPIGFSINEIGDTNYTACHFQKSVASFENSDVFLTNYVAKDLVKLGYKYINWEQDLGLASLRNLKLSYKPKHMLKKYSVRFRAN